MLKDAVAGTLLLVALLASGSASVAAPRNDDCVNCEPSGTYDSESPARIRREMDRARIPDAGQAESDTAAAPERTSGAPARECADCPPPKHYDKIEVVKTSRDVDRSGVINTESVVHVRPRVKEVNKLVIHENETRNVGVIQHNHRIIEKEIRYVKRAPVYRKPRIETVLVPVVVPQSPPCGCSCSCSASRYGYDQAYGYAYAYAPARTVVQQVLVPVQVPAVYGYR